MPTINVTNLPAAPLRKIDAHERLRAVTAAGHARLRLGGALGDLVAREIEAWVQLGYVGDPTGLMPAVVDQLMHAEPAALAPTPGTDSAQAAPAAERPRPSVSRIVHYVSHGSPALPDGTQEYASECRAAMVTLVHDDELDLVALTVFGVNGVFQPQAVALDEGLADHQRVPGDGRSVLCTGRAHGRGTWHWPART